MSDICILCYSPVDTLNEDHTCEDCLVGLNSQVDTCRRNFWIVVLVTATIIAISIW